MPRRSDPGYSFRSAESLRLDAERRRQDPAGGGEDGNDCAQGTFCHAATRDDTGQWHPARTYQNFCPACRAAIAGRLAELPEAFVRLAMAARDRPRTGNPVRVPSGPRELIRLDVDALMRLMGWVLGSWHERIARVFTLTPPEVSAAAVQHPGRAVRDAVRAICPPGVPDRVDALLAFAAEPMVRIMYDPAAAEDWLAAVDPAEQGRVRRSGEADMSPALSGVHAGREILELHRRARRILGQVKAPPESFDGIPCRACEAMSSLERAEPPSDPRREAPWSRCAECGDLMNRETFGEWVTWYHGWAAAATGLACRRCQKGACAQCQWAGCACRAAGHGTTAA